MKTGAKSALLFSFFLFFVLFPHAAHAIALIAHDDTCLGILQNFQFISVDAETFSAILSQVKNRSFLRERSTAEYGEIIANGGQLFLSSDNLLGYGIKADGMLISVFNDSGQKGMGTAAIQYAILHGATSLWCAGPLETYYAQFGFRTVETKEMTPENGGYNLNWPNGIRPPMVRMELQREP